MMEYKDLPIVGKTCTSVYARGKGEVRFICDDGSQWEMWHYQDCCEDVHIEDICGDLEDLTGVPLLVAEACTNADVKEQCTWTFYRFSTIKGSVTIRWIGTSNGYYSEEVDFEEVGEKDKS